MYFYHIIVKYRVEHQKFIRRSDSSSKPFVGPHEHIGKGPRPSLATSADERIYRESKSWAFLRCIDPGPHRNISADIHLLLKQTCKTQLKRLFCVVVGTKGLSNTSNVNMVQVSNDALVSDQGCHISNSPETHGLNNCALSWGGLV